MRGTKLRSPVNLYTIVSVTPKYIDRRLGVLGGISTTESKLPICDLTACSAWNVGNTDRFSSDYLLGQKIIRDGRYTRGARHGACKEPSGGSKGGG